jgi:menaquinone-dependent protoporphyrinogen oxidase
VGSIDDYDAMVLGSAIYNARWRPEMIRFLQRLIAFGYQGPIWLFHSGPLGDDQAAEEQPLPKKARDLAEALIVREVTTFGGRLPEHPEGMLAKWMAKSGAGDWRDFEKVDELADGIASALTASDTSV